jgi:hypothetical protein
MPPSPFAKEGSIVLSFSSDGKDHTHLTRYPNPINLPPDATNVRIALVEATIWNTVANIVEPNNVIHIQYKWTAFEAIYWKSLHLVIPPGLYNVDQLNTCIERLLRDAELDPNLFFLRVDLPTDKIMFCSQGATYRDEIKLLNPPSTPRSLLGLPELDSYEIVVGYENQVLAPYKAKFNQMNWFVLRNSLASPGLNLNAETRNILGRVYIDDAPNTMLVYEPSYPIFVPARDLQWTGKISEVVGQWMQDDGFTPAVTHNPWQYTVEILYDTSS